MLHKTQAEIEAHIHAAQITGNFLLTGPRTVRFSHDRLRMAAYNLIPQDQLASVHHRVSVFLCQPDLREDFIFEAADHALAASSSSVGCFDCEELVILLLDAASRSALSAAFWAAKRYLDAVKKVVHAAGGVTQWCASHRRLHFRFLGIYSEVCSVLKLHEDAFAKVSHCRRCSLSKELYEMVPLCETDAERVRIATLRVRQKISGGLLCRIVVLTGSQSTF